jgi:hypothetical protein
LLRSVTTTIRAAASGSARGSDNFNLHATLTIQNPYHQVKAYRNLTKKTGVARISETGSYQPCRSSHQTPGRGEWKFFILSCILWTVFAPLPGPIDELIVWAYITGAVDEEAWIDPGAPAEGNHQGVGATRGRPGKGPQGGRLFCADRHRTVRERRQPELP